MPWNLENLILRSVLNTLGAMRLDSIFRSQKLKKLKNLEIMGTWGDPGSVGPCCFGSNLTSLTTNCDVGKLLPFKAPWTGLPSNL